MRIQGDHSGQTEVIAFGLALILFVGLAASWSFENTTANLVVIPPAAFFLLAIYAIRLSKLAYVEVDQPQDCICTHNVDFLGKRRKESYRLSDFHGVVSFLNSRNINGGAQYNYVELLSKHEGKGLVITRFEPTKPDQKILSRPAHSESERAKEVRRYFAESCGMTDLGFAGHRHFREQLHPSNTCV